MASEQFVNVSYRGIDVGQSLRLAEFGPSTAYLQVTTPMPVGTQLDLETDGGLSIAARVLRVQEQVAGAEHSPGMRIVVSDLSGEAKTWWQGLVEGDDPTIPEPHIIVEPLSEVADAVSAAPSAAVEAELAAPAAPSAAVEASGLSAPAPKDGKSRTLVMDVSELQAALAAGGATVDGDSSAVPGDIDARPTVEMAAVDIAAIEAEMAATQTAEAAESAKAAETPEPEGKKKKKKRRRRKKS